VSVWLSSLPIEHQLVINNTRSPPAQQEHGTFTVSPVGCRSHSGSKELCSDTFRYLPEKLGIVFREHHTVGKFLLRMNVVPIVT
jgi:hypothetical protein